MTHTYAPQQDGFTLIEALAVLAITGLLAGFALPQFQELHERWKVMETARAMESTLMLARSHAIRYGGNIGIRKRDQETDKNGCQNASTTREWGCGWIVYEDVNRNGSWNSKTDRKLHEVRLDGSINVMHTSGGNNIKFDRYGMASGLNAKGFTLSPERTGVASSATQTLCMGAGGRIRIVEDVGCPK